MIVYFLVMKSKRCPRENDACRLHTLLYTSTHIHVHARAHLREDNHVLQNITNCNFFVVLPLHVVPQRFRLQSRFLLVARD